MLVQVWKVQDVKDQLVALGMVQRLAMRGARLFVRGVRVSEASVGAAHHFERTKSLTEDRTAEARARVDDWKVVQMAEAQVRVDDWKVLQMAEAQARVDDSTYWKEDQTVEAEERHRFDWSSH